MRIESNRAVLEVIRLVKGIAFRHNGFTVYKGIEKGIDSLLNGENVYFTFGDANIWATDVNVSACFRNLTYAKTPIYNSENQFIYQGKFDPQIEVSCGGCGRTPAYAMTLLRNWSNATAFAAELEAAFRDLEIKD